MASFTISLDKTTVTLGGIFTVTGSYNPNTNINILADNKILTSVSTDNNGNFSQKIKGAIAGTYNINACDASNNSICSNNVTLVVTGTSITINVEIVEGRGSVIAKQNGTIVKTVNPGDGIVAITYNNGDTFEFDAFPDTTLGYSFNKFCGDASCTISTTSSSFSGSVTASGYVGVYFKGTPATVQVNVGAGQGTVNVYRNTRLIGTVTTSASTFNFFVNDNFTFTAVPASNYQFDKFCSDQACTITTNTNPFSGTITQASGTVSAYFKANVIPATVTIQRSAGSGSVAVLKNGVSIGSLAETDTTKVFNFSVGDAFTFAASPASGYKFDKFCGDSGCSVTTTTNPFTGVIAVATGQLFAYFSPTTPPSQVGSISFTSTPAGAEVILDNVTQASKTPVTVNNVPAGSHNYTLKLFGYDDYTGTINVQANTTATVSATLVQTLLFGLPQWEVYAGAAVGGVLLLLLLTRSPRYVETGSPRRYKR